MFEVVVIGGGPSGATAAEDLARSGHKVALLDRDGRIKPCGGAIPPRLIADFDIPDDQLIARSTDRAHDLADRARRHPDRERLVGMVDRKDFDPFLRARAEAAGAERFTGTFLRIEREGKDRFVVYRDKETGEEAAETRLIIGADGASRASRHRRSPAATRPAGLRLSRDHRRPGRERPL